MSKRTIIFAIVVIMLFTFSVAPPAHAIVPLAAWAIWGIAVGVTSVAAVAKKTSDHEQAKAKNQAQEDGKGMKSTASQLQESPG
jgi:predicted MFS family arabinose efflux permease